MSSLAIRLVLIYVLFYADLTSSLKRKNLSCTQTQTCVCEYPSGEGLNLTGLSSRLFSLDDKDHNVTFYFNPCRNILDPSACPNTTSICFLNKTADSFVSLGNVSETSFRSHGPFISLVYNHTPIYTEIQLECSDDLDAVFSLSNENKENSRNDAYYFTFRSSVACLTWVSSNSGSTDGDLSTGSVLVILFLVFGSVYLFGGSGAKFFLQGAKGWEMIPNRDFWIDLPKLCMDGFKFAINGCSVPPSYEQI